MSADTMAARAVTHRTRGRRHGPITRLMSPGDLGQVLKPFVFLDLFAVESHGGPGFPPHPHSGIATVTTFLEGRMTYADSTGAAGTLAGGAVEWMRSGRGVWHTGGPVPGTGPARGFQLWLALPPEQELAEPESLYLPAEQVAAAGPARVILGAHEGLGSKVPAGMPVTLLHVRLRDGERWRFTPAAGQSLAWLALAAGRLRVAGQELEREMAVFAPGEGAIEVEADGSAEFLLGAGAPNPWPVVTGYYSVHTDASALEQGERRIAELEQAPEVAALRAA